MRRLGRRFLCIQNCNLSCSVVVVGVKGRPPDLWPLELLRQMFYRSLLTWTRPLSARPLRRLLFRLGWRICAHWKCFGGAFFGCLRPARTLPFSARSLLPLLIRLWLSGLWPGEALLRRGLFRSLLTRSRSLSARSLHPLLFPRWVTDDSPEKPPSVAPGGRHFRLGPCAAPSSGREDALSVSSVHRAVLTAVKKHSSGPTSSSDFLPQPRSIPTLPRPRHHSDLAITMCLDWLPPECRPRSRDVALVPAWRLSSHAARQRRPNRSPENDALEAE